MKLKFVETEHRDFYWRCVFKDQCAGDSERMAFFYTLGIVEETRRRIKQIYDFGRRTIYDQAEILFQPWQTGTSVKLTRLAYNLYSGYHGLDYDPDDNEMKIEPPAEYTPYELFAHELAEYALIAVAIRHSRYIGIETSDIESLPGAGRGY